MKVEEVKLEDIKVEDRDRQDLGDIETLAADIERKGLIHPITIDKYNKLLSGERRLEAFKYLGRKYISAVVRESGYIDSKEIEFLENMSRLDFNWVERCRSVKNLYERINPQYVKETGKNISQRDFAKYIGRSQRFVGEHLEMAGNLDADPEYEKHKTLDDAQKEAKKLEEAVAVQEMKKRHKEGKSEAPPFTEGYIAGDCLEEIGEIESDSCHLAEVDPPYAVSLDTFKREGKMDDYNEWTLDFYTDQFFMLLKEVYRVLAPGSHALIWYGMSNHTLTHELVRGAGFRTPEFPAIWYKGKTGQTNHPDLYLASSYEPFIYAKKATDDGNAIISQVREGRSNVFHYSPVPPKQKFHPTQKPLELMQEVLETFALPGSRIIVPFLGSGATLIAAENASMTAFGWDLSDTYQVKFIEYAKKSSG